MINHYNFGYIPEFWRKPMGDHSKSKVRKMFDPLQKTVTLLCSAISGLVLVCWRNVRNIHRELRRCFPAVCLQSVRFGVGLIFPARCRTTSKQFAPLPAAANTRTTQSLRAASCFPLCQVSRFTVYSQPCVGRCFSSFSRSYKCQTLLAGLLGSVQNATCGIVSSRFLLGHVAFCL